MIVFGSFQISYSCCFWLGDTIQKTHGKLIGLKTEKEVMGGSAVQSELNTQDRIIVTTLYDNGRFEVEVYQAQYDKDEKEIRFGKLIKRTDYDCNGEPF